jgi:hypothetical protein
MSVYRIERRILYVRGQKVMLDSDLADLYGVSTGRLNEQVSRNSDRFPSDFAFRLTADEMALLISQNATSSSGHGGRRRSTPRVFTEQGVAMLSSVLRSKRAIDVNIAIMRAFVHLRELLATHKDLARRIEDMERRYEGKFAAIFEAIKRLIAADASDLTIRRRIGFHNSTDGPE